MGTSKNSRFDIKISPFLKRTQRQDIRIMHSFLKTYIFKNEKIFKMLKQGVPKINVARGCGVHRSTLRRFLKEIETKKKN